MTDTHKEPKHIVTFNGDAPLIIALDTTASMNAPHIHPSDRTRYQYALERLDELLTRVPRDTRVSVLTGDAIVIERANDVSGQQARAALQLADAPGGATSNHGRMLEAVLEAFWNARRVAARVNLLMPEATLLLVTDGVPDDAWRYEAFLREALRTHVIGSVIVLWVGPDADEQVRSWFGTDAAADAVYRGRVSFLPLTEDTEIRMSTRTQSDKPEPAKRPTAPPSISPPTPGNALGVGAVTDEQYAQAKRRTVHDELGITPEHARQARIEHGDGVDVNEPLPTVLQDVPAETDPRIGGVKSTEYVDPKRHAPEPPAKHGKSTRPSGGSKR